MSDWTLAATDMLTTLWADGKSASEISRALWGRLGADFTRNAVIGKVHRLRLPGRRRAPRKAVPRKEPTRAMRALPAARVARPQLPPKPRTKPAPIAPRPIPTEAPKPMNLTLMHLTERNCKWPVNDPPRGEPHLFCGAPKEAGKQPYCPHHTARAWGAGTPSERRAGREAGRVPA